MKHWKEHSSHFRSGVIHLLLILALLFFLGHESQHDLPSAIDVDTTQCEFCLNGTGPLGITNSVVAEFDHAHDFFVRQYHELGAILSFLGFSFTSRAPPVA